MPKTLYSLGQNAFMPYEQIKIDNSSLNSTLYRLYGDQACYVYEDDSQYKAQLTILIHTFANIVLDDEFNPNLENISQGVQLLKARLGDIDYVSPDPEIQAAYYQTYKKNLETIFFLIKDWEETKKREFIMQLGEKILVCATGAHTQLAEFLFELTEKPTLTSWLAGLRKNIIHQFSENCIANNQIADGDSIHVHYFCQTFAEACGWNIPGYHMILGYSDARFKPQKLDSTTQKELKSYFETQYNYQAMNENVVVNFNLLLSYYYNIPLKPEHNVIICSILEPFTRHGIFDMHAVYSFDDEWRIKPDFQVNLPKYVTALLLKEKIIFSNIHTIVNDEMIPLIEMEIERLKLKYDKADNRIQILENTIDFLLLTITKDETTNYYSDISTHINEIYLKNSLDKYSVLEKIGICLLNILMVLPFGITGAFKSARTGSFFFSLHGRSQDLLDTMHKRLLLAAN